MYGDSQVKDKTVARPSYLQHEDPYTGKTASLYWDGPLNAQKPHYELPSRTRLYCDYLAENLPCCNVTTMHWYNFGWNIS